MERIELLINPVRQRIFQYLLVHETASVKDIRKALPDIPSASLYRHMKLLADNSILTVVGENRIRGTVESIYRLDRSALELDDAEGAGLQTALLSICASFAKYFAGGHADPHRDMLMLSACTLKLTDAEFMSFLSEISQIAVKYKGRAVQKDSKTRQITLISAPADEQVL